MNNTAPKSVIRVSKSAASGNVIFMSSGPIRTRPTRRSMNFICKNTKLTIFGGCFGYFSVDLVILATLTLASQPLRPKMSYTGFPSPLAAFAFIAMDLY